MGGPPIRGSLCVRTATTPNRTAIHEVTMSAVMMPSTFSTPMLQPVAADATRPLIEERDFLKACIRAEFEAARRGQSSIQIVDDLCRRLDRVESRLMGELEGAAETRRCA
jgi:hypothetical protein